MTFNPKYGPGASISVDPDTLHGRRAIENAAILCQEANHGYCQAIGEPNSSPWATAPEDQRASVIRGVHSLIADPSTTPEQSHELWIADKAKDGWVVGEVKDAWKKTHPCMVPYADLPESQRRKDVLFQAITRATLDVYGIRFAHFDVERKVEAGNLGNWHCHRKMFNIGMYVITGRADQIVERATGDLALTYGQRVVDHGTRRNERLAVQMQCAMTSRDAADAYGYWAASKWPEEVPEFSGERTLVHWNVLVALTHAVMEIEGVVASKQPINTRWYRQPTAGTGADYIDVKLTGSFAVAAGDEP